MEIVIWGTEIGWFTSLVDGWSKSSKKLRTHFVLVQFRLQWPILVPVFMHE